MDPNFEVIISNQESIIKDVEELSNYVNDFMETECNLEKEFENFKLADIEISKKPLDTNKKKKNVLNELIKEKRELKAELEINLLKLEKLKKSLNPKSAVLSWKLLTDTVFSQPESGCYVAKNGAGEVWEVDLSSPDLHDKMWDKLKQ